MNFTHPYSSELSAFLIGIKDRANELDTDAGLLFDTYKDFCDSGLHRAGTPAMPLVGGSAEWFQFLSEIAATSGSLAWVALQQYAANPYVAQCEFNVWPRLGTAIGHLRAGKVGVAPTWMDGHIDGFSPWYSGAHIAEQCVIGFFLPDGREAYAVIDAQDRAEFSFSKPLALQACSSTTNVSITFENLLVNESEFLQIEPAGCRAWQDRQGSLNQLPMSLGCAKASLDLILEGSRFTLEQKQKCEAGFWECFDEVIRESAEPVDIECRATLRARSTEMAVQLARLATLATLPNGIKQHSTAARLYREALFFTCVGPQDRVADMAIERAFPATAASPTNIRLGVAS